MAADGPDPVWRGRTSDDSAALDRAKQVTGVKAASHDDGGLVVFAAQDRLDDYVLHLGREGVAIRGLELDVTPLESLFFQLTGEPQRQGLGGTERRPSEAADQEVR